MSDMLARILRLVRSKPNIAFSANMDDVTSPAGVRGRRRSEGREEAAVGGGRSRLRRRVVAVDHVDGLPAGAVVVKHDPQPGAWRAALAHLDHRGGARAQHPLDRDRRVGRESTPSSPWRGA